MTHISAPLSRLFHRGDLPMVLQANREYGPLLLGDVVTWRGDGFCTSDLKYVFYPYFIRQHLGGLFTAVEIEEKVA